jgi:hypothetical protein
MRKSIIIGIIILIVLVTSGFFIIKAVNQKSSNLKVSQNVDPTPEIIPEVDSSIKVVVKLIANNTVSMNVTGLDGKMKSMDYELTYDSQGLIKGVNSGSKPVDLIGKSEISRDIYMGTCSRNVCKPDLGVKTVSVVLELMSTNDKKSQFSQDFDL